jgi:hypothetical protein
MPNISGRNAGLDAIELSQFWAISAELNAAARTDSRAADNKVLRLLDELEGMAFNTQQPVIRERCGAILRTYSDPTSSAICRSKSS